MAVGDGTFTGSNSTATTDGSATCGLIGNPGGNDVWWRYVAGATGTATLDTCGSTFDTLLSVRDVCGGAEVACNDDQLEGGCSRPPPVLQSRVQLDVVEGTSYFVRVAGWGGDRGAITLNIRTQEDPGTCGNGTCDSQEDACTCPMDSCAASCGDLCCSHDEEPDDCSSDCATLSDAARFQICFGDTIPFSAGCNRFDFDENGAVGLPDHDRFVKRMFVGP